MSDGFIERKILISLITDDEFAKAFSKQFTPQWFGSDTARLIAQWCWEYSQEYNRAPGRKDFETLFNGKKADLSPSQALDLEELLSDLSNEFEKGTVNNDYLLTETKRHFEAQSIRNLIEQLQRNVNGDSTTPEALAEAHKVIEGFKTRSIGDDDSSTVNPLEDLDAVKRAFMERPEPLIYFARALGDFWNDQMYRSALIGLLAPEKRGKSWMLLELAMMALRSKRRVAIFQAGDMSESQQLVRIYMRVSGRPAPAKTPWREEEDEEEFEHKNGALVAWLPELDCVKNLCGTCPYNDTKREESGQEALFPAAEWQELGDDVANAMKERMTKRKGERWQSCTACKDSFEPAISLHRKEIEKPLDLRSAYKAAMKWRKQYKGQLHLATYVNETLTVSEIKRRLNEWEKEDEGKIDVVIIDYADLLAPDADYARMEWRHQINKTWQRMRALSEQYNCLVVTATQADAASYDKELLGPSNFSEDKRKFSHCTAFYGLNQTMQEKMFGILRINQLMVREGDFNVRNQVRILQALNVGKPILSSY